MRVIDAQWFWPKVSIGTDDTCWPWRGMRDRNGYGRVEVGTKVRGNRKVYFAHRLAWLFANGEMPTGLVIRHTCDNPPCVNPSHLLSGTQADNLKDMVSKGRHWLTVDPTRMRGLKNPAAKYSDEEIANVRRLHASGLSMYRISKITGISGPHVHKVCLGIARIPPDAPEGR